MSSLITVIHVITCVLLVLVVLLQQGKGAEISASFGGSSQTVFGSSGGANFFVKFTSVLATIFMVCSLLLTLMGTQSRKSIFEGAPTTGIPAKAAAPSLPAAPTGGGASAPAQSGGGAPKATGAPAAPSAKH